MVDIDSSSQAAGVNPENKAVLTKSQKNKQKKAKKRAKPKPADTGVASASAVAQNKAEEPIESSNDTNGDSKPLEPESSQHAVPPTPPSTLSGGSNSVNESVDAKSGASRNDHDETTTSSPAKSVEPGSDLSSPSTRSLQLSSEIATLAVKDLSEFDTEGCEAYDAFNFTWHKALEYAYTEIDAFREDFIRNETYPDHLRLTKLNTTTPQHIKDKAFIRLVYSTARQVHIQMRDAKLNIRVFMLRVNGTVGAVSLLKLPDYISPQQTSLWHRAVTEFLRAIYKVADWWTWLEEPSNPLNLEAMRTEFEQAFQDMDLAVTPKRLEVLKGMSPANLQNAVYPKDLAYSLRRLSVRESAQGKGLGKKLMDYTLAALKPFERPPTSLFNGPAKFELFSSPVARQFYLRYGFSVGETWESPYRALTHVLFVANLD